MQATAKGRGRKRSTQLIIDDAEEVQIRGTVSAPLYAYMNCPACGECNTGF